ncbi:MAG TPA: polysaccharide deacetylase family protein [Candidatus Acidoferrales bacterium]|nr:polysaccharide deacetylase family protein [Candidatus Acidoferrales bacterium]
MIGPFQILLATRAASAAASAAGGLFAWGAAVPSAQIFGRTVRRTGDLSTMALTFDDGPNPAVTPELLDMLDRHGASATFFLIGKRVRQFPDIAREIAARGHTIGNHTDAHPGLTLLSSRRIADELSRCDDAIAEAVNILPRWMRPPFGLRGPQLQRVLRQRRRISVAMWSRWARDWKPQQTHTVIQSLSRARGGDIVLLHDGDHRSTRGDRRHTIDALDYWLPRWKQAGIGFVKLDEIAEQPEQPQAA